MYICVPRVCLGGQRRVSEKGVRSRGTSGTEGCELPCGWWQWNLGPLQEEQMLLTKHLTVFPAPTSQSK